MPLINEISTLLVGAVLGGIFTTWFQGRRAKRERILENVFREMGDEITHATLNGDISQENRLSAWVDIDAVSRKELPAPIRKEFAAYFQRSADLSEQKEILDNLRNKMFPQYANRSDLLKLDGSTLRVASNHEFIDQDIGYQTTYGVDFEDWILEYGNVISTVFESASEYHEVSNDDIVNAIREHEVENEELVGIPEVWDQIVGEGDWGAFVRNMFSFGAAGRFRLHLVLLKEVKSDIQESAEELDKWMEILVTSTYLIPYWPRIKMKSNK